MPEPVAILADPATRWRIARAGRAALLIDGSAYFSALASAMEQARRSITIVGWDIRSDLVLEPEHSTETLADRLTRLLDANPDLEIRLLIWDWIIAYSLDREFLPQWQLAPLHDRLTFVLDDALPTGASHHEKVVVIDGRLAFVGGLDLSDGRWDTPAHDPTSASRAAADTGNRRLPFHDVMMVIDGEAAAAVAELVERRWQRATDERLTIRQEDAAGEPPWPEGVAPELRDQPVAIARTRPDYAGSSAAREILALYLAAIRAAERLIYIENQYLTEPAVAEALAKRLCERPELELVIITPDKCEGALENAVMDKGRAAFVATLEQASRDRLVVLTPFVRDVGIHVHAKVMVVDDRFVTLGSANLAKRSMGVDSEINLAMEHDAALPVLRRWRQRLLAEHLGAEPERLAALEGETGSVLAAIAALNDPGAPRHCRPLELDGAELPAPLDELAELGDPAEPLIPDQILGPSLPLRERRRWRRWAGRLAGLAGAAAVAAAWLAPPALAPSPWIALPVGLALVLFWVAAERLWRPGLQ